MSLKKEKDLYPKISKWLEDLLKSIIQKRLYIHLTHQLFI